MKTPPFFSRDKMAAGSVYTRDLEVIDLEVAGGAKGR
jgi:hypothetical protein